MAEAFLRHLAADRFDAHSAGTRPTTVNPLAIVVMREKGIDLSRQRSKSASEYLGQYFGYIITVCDNAREHCPIFPGPSVRLHWSFPDPAEAIGTDDQRLPVFRQVRDAIEEQVRRFITSAP